MKIGKDFNKLTLREYFHCIENHKKYTDFNTLGLYRSIPENTKLSLEEKLELRDFAHRYFRKTFDFLQLKDPGTFFLVSTLGQVLTIPDETQFWRNIASAQQKILKDKKIKHRNFGIYSKHKCGWDDCPWNGMMVRQGTFPAYASIHFKSDHPRQSSKEKLIRLKKEARKKKDAIRKASEDD